MSTMRVPTAVWRAAGVGPYEAVTQTPVTHGTGVATGTVELITGRRGDESTTIVAKTLRPLTSGRHAEASRRIDHWAYWRRELLAHQSGLLPSGPGLRAPRLLGTDGDTLFTEYVGGPGAGRRDCGAPSRTMAAGHPGANHAVDDQ